MKHKYYSTLAEVMHLMQAMCVLVNAEHGGITLAAFKDSCHASVAQSKQSVLPVPVGLSNRAFFPCILGRYHGGSQHARYQNDAHVSTDLLMSERGAPPVEQ